MASAVLSKVLSAGQELWDAARFGIKLGLSCQAVRMQYFELLRRDAPPPASRVGVAANILDGAAGRQAVYVTLEVAPRSNPGLWLRIDVFGREGYRQTFYPFWRDPEVFHDFLAVCAEIAESPRTAPEEAPPDDPARYPLTVETDYGPAPAASPPEGRSPEGRSPEAWRRLVEWLRNRFRPARRAARRRNVTAPSGRQRSAANAGHADAHWAAGHPEADSGAIQATATSRDTAPGQCRLMRFAHLGALLDHVLLSGNRVAIKVAREGPDLWAVVWRRADGGLYLRWGGLDHPAGPIYRESPQGMYDTLSEYDLDLDRVWSQSRPA